MKKTLSAFRATILLFLIFSFNVALAQWTSHGPYGGTMLSLKARGSDLFTGTTNGVFKSTDNGLHWTAANNGLQRLDIAALAINSSGLFAGSASNGVFLSSNDGNSWTNRSNGLTNLHINSLFTTTAGIFAGTPDGVFFSSNDGMSWNSANNGIPATYVIYSWAQMGDTVYAGSYGMGLFMSTDNGTNWLPVGGGFPPTTLTGPFVYSLLSDGDEIYAGTSAGVYKSPDRGITWMSSNTGFPPGMWASALTAKPGYIFAGTHTEGIFVSTDNGANWSPANNGLYDWSGTSLPHGYARVNEMAVSYSYILAAMFDGMYRSGNNGSSWNNSSEGILATDITACVASGSLVMAGTNFTGIYTSTDQGLTWNRTNNGLAGPDVTDMTRKGSWTIAGILNHKVYRSNDDGASWTAGGNGLPNTIRHLDSDSTRVYAVGGGGIHTTDLLYISSDDGLNFSAIMGSNAISGGMMALEVQGGYIYIGTANGMVLRSNDDGATWQDISVYLPNVEITAILAMDDIVYIGTAGKGVWKFNANNFTMIPSGTGMTNNYITDIDYENGALFASTWGGGIFASTNGGQQWFALNEGLDNKFVSCLASDVTKVFAGTDAGVYNSDEDLFTQIGILAGLRRHQNDQYKLYPNPVKDKLYVSGIDKGEVKIHDITGALIYQRKISGDGEIYLGALASGVYAVEVTADGFREVNKIVVE